MPRGKYNYRKKNQKSNLATKAYVQKQFKKNLELKFEENGTTGATLSYDAPTFVCLTDSQRGTNAIDYIGREVQGVDLMVKGMVHNINSTNFEYARILIFQYFDDGTPTGPNILQLQGSSLTSNSWLYANYNQDNRERYRILYDKRFILGGDTLAENAGAVPHQRLFSKKLNFKKDKMRRKIIFEDNQAKGINHVWLMAISENTSVSGLGPDIACLGMFRYTDA